MGIKDRPAGGKVMEQPGDDPFGTTYRADNGVHYGTIAPTKTKIKFPDRDAVARIVGGRMTAKDARTHADAYFDRELKKHRDTRGVLGSIYMLSKMGFKNGAFKVKKRGLKRLLNDLHKLGFHTWVETRENDIVQVEVEWHKEVVL
jgi:hypothetical protein